MSDSSAEVTQSELGIVGLGRMGALMVERLVERGVRCVAYDLDAAAVAAAEASGAEGVHDPAALVAALQAPRAIWIMVPAAVVDRVIAQLRPLLSRDDTLIDGGNSHYHDDIARAESLAADGIHYVDVGTSGGVFGRDRGYCLMIGGEAAAVDRLNVVFEALAPGVDAAERTAGRDGPATTDEQGWLHCGPVGAGHFVKMVHNGIEYGMMAAIAEGLNLLDNGDAGSVGRSVDAETAPLRNPEHFQYDFDLPAIAELWRRGSVISSWLIDLTARGLLLHPELAGFTGKVADSGEGRWMLEAAVEAGVPTPVLAASLFSRFASRDDDETANKVLSVMRQQFGGHSERPA